MSWNSMKPPEKKKQKEKFTSDWVEEALRETMQAWDGAM